LKRYILQHLNTFVVATDKPGGQLDFRVGGKFEKKKRGFANANLLARVSIFPGESHRHLNLREQT